MNSEICEHILVFEPRSGVRQLLHEMLDELDYRVTAVADLPAAESALKQGNVDLLIVEHRRSGYPAELAAVADGFEVPCVILSMRQALASPVAVSHETRTLQGVVKAVTETLKRDRSAASRGERT